MNQLKLKVKMLFRFTKDEMELEFLNEEQARNYLWDMFKKHGPDTQGGNEQLASIVLTKEEDGKKTELIRVE